MILFPLLALALTSSVGQEHRPPTPGLRLGQPLEYPARALRQDLSGDVVLNCAVLEEGLLDGCAVVSESPFGAGFGPAAIRAANGGRLGEGAANPPSGGRVSFRLRFRTAAAEPGPAAEPVDGVRP